MLSLSLSFSFSLSLSLSFSFFLFFFLYLSPFSLGIPLVNFELFIHYHSGFTPVVLSLCLAFSFSFFIIRLHVLFLTRLHYFLPPLSFVVFHPSIQWNQPAQDSGSHARCIWR